MAKKNKKESKPRTPAPFAAAAQVRVKLGTTDPEFSDIPLGGWAGTIQEVDQRSASPTYLTRCTGYCVRREPRAG
jgi:hypothetical protein